MKTEVTATNKFRSGLILEFVSELTEYLNNDMFFNTVKKDYTS